MGPAPRPLDSKPAIGPAPALRDVYLAAGHGHMGLGLSAIPGRLIADLVGGREPSVCLEPFFPSRVPWRFRAQMRPNCRRSV